MAKAKPKPLNKLERLLYRAFVAELCYTCKPAIERWARRTGKRILKIKIRDL